MVNRPRANLTKRVTPNARLWQVYHRMEAGKARLARDTVRDATRAEVANLKRENERLKQVVADLSLQVHVLKKTEVPGLE